MEKIQIFIITQHLGPSAFVKIDGFQDNDPKYTFK